MTVRVGRNVELSAGTFRLVFARRQLPSLLQMLTLGVLGAAKRRHEPIVHSWLRHVAPPSSIEYAVLQSIVDSDERVLAWLATGTYREIRSPWLGTCHARLHFLATEKRCALVAVSDNAPPASEWFEPSPMATTTTRTTLRLRLGAQSFISAPTNAPLFAEFASLTALNSTARLRAAAELNWRLGERGPQQVSVCLDLLDAASKAGDDLAPFAIRWLATNQPSASDPAELAGWLARVKNRKRASGCLADLWSAFGEPLQEGIAMVNALRLIGEDAEPYAVTLHVRVSERNRALLKRPDQRFQSDLELAAHLCQAGSLAQAEVLLKQLRRKSPPRQLEDFAAPKSPRAALVRRVLELSVLVSTTGNGATHARRELARHGPLEARLQRSLARHAKPPADEVGRRALILASLLEAPFAQLASNTPHAQAPPLSVLDPQRPFSRTELHKLIPTEVSDDATALLRRMSATLAKSTGPSATVLAAYVERLVEGYERLYNVLQHAAHLLGLGSVGLYIARGELAQGIRAYEAPAPCILVGHRHLQQNSAEYLSESELAFVLGGEVAHLRFGETRVNSLDVWLGALDITRQGLGFALGALPVLGQAKALAPLQHLFRRVPSNSLQALLRILATGVNASRNASGSRQSPTHPRSAQIPISAHRLMLLRADRMGLLCCVDPAVALRTMVRFHYPASLWSDIDQQAPAGIVLQQLALATKLGARDFAIRAAALCSFWISSDFDELRAVATGQRTNPIDTTA